jgi:hypothetical protein
MADVTAPDIQDSPVAESPAVSLLGGGSQPTPPEMGPISGMSPASDLGGTSQPQGPSKVGLVGGLVRGLTPTDRVDPNTGNVISMNQDVNMTGPGKFGNVMASMLIGALGGLAKTRPGVRGGAAFGQGVEGGNEAQQNVDEIARKKAQQDFQNQNALKDEARKTQEAADAHTISQAHLSLIGQQAMREHFDMTRLTGKDRQEAQDRLATEGKTTLAPFLAVTEPVYKDIPESKMQETMDKDPKGHSYLWQATGSTPILDPATGKQAVDENGVPEFQQTYTAVNPTGQVTLTQGQIDLYKSYGVPGADKMQAGVAMPANKMVALEAAADRAKNITTQKQVIEDRAAKLAQEKATLANTNAEANKNNAEAAKARQDANQQGALNPQAANGLVGEEYLSSLPGPQQSILRAIGEGRETRSARQLQDKNGNPTPLALALHRAYPDFDITKVDNFHKVRQDYSSPNGTGGRITAFGTVLNHMRRLYDNATLGSLIPGTEANRKLSVDTHNVAVEMANALTTHGKAAEAEIQAQEKALNALTPEGRREKIREAAQLLNGKLAEMEQQWDNAAPSSTHHPSMPTISDEAKANSEYIRNGGKQHAAPEQPSGPVGSQPVIVNGKVVGHSTDGGITMIPVTQ